MATGSSFTTFTWNAVVIDAVGSVSYSASRPPIEVTQVGAANSLFIPGVLTSGLSVDLYWATANHAAITAYLLNGASAAFIFTLNTGDTISGTGLITGIDISSGVADVSRASMSIVCTGIVTFVAVPAASGVNES